MKWDVIEAKWEGFPLILRKPEYKDIYEFKNKYTKLLTITHNLSEVKSNGLPEGKYNMSLEKFDQRMVGLFNRKKEGIIILIETFGGRRHYYFYITNSCNYKTKIDVLNKNFSGHNIEIKEKADVSWSFISDYPLKIYNK